MRIVSISEDINIERRISITPEIAKKYISNGFDVSLSQIWKTFGIRDEDYLKLGVKISENEKEIIESADIIVQLNLPTKEKLSYFKENQVLIGVLNPFKNKNLISDMVKSKIYNFFIRVTTKNNESSINGYIILTSKPSWI